MNYYKRHLGDYAKDTSHLSVMEHGAYTLLLDYYYSTEKPIPDDRCERIAKAYAEDERAAVAVVLSEFFKRKGKFWIHSKCEHIIDEAKQKTLSAQSSATARWHGKKDANALRTHCERNASHKPLATTPLTTTKKDQKIGAEAPDLFPGIDHQAVADFKALRKAKKSPITKTAIEGIFREAAKAGMSPQEAITICCERGWAGFKAEWIKGDSPGTDRMPRAGPLNRPGVADSFASKTYTGTPDNELPSFLRDAPTA